MSRCRNELDIIMNEAMIEDARRGIVLSRNSQKFAAFAGFYVPFSFKCSVFGMDFIQIDGFGKGFELWIAVSMPVSVSLTVLFWNSDYVNRLWEETRLRKTRQLGDSRRFTDL